MSFTKLETKTSEGDSCKAGNENERIRREGGGGFMEKERGHKSSLAGEIIFYDATVHIHVRGSTILVMQSYPVFPQRVVRNCVIY